MLIERISQETGLTVQYLALMERTASHRYKCYPIKKRNGGDRIIAHPSRQLKSLQRWLVANLFAHLPIHSAATAYTKGSTVFANAEYHVRSNYLLKLDIEQFFPSLNYGDLFWLLTSKQLSLPFALDERDRTFVAKIVTRKGALPVGAPSSPTISNQLMYDFDVEISAVCKELGVSYSRYADDMCFSANEPNILSEVHRYVAKSLGTREHPRLKLNDQKVVHTSRRRLRMVTGLVLTSDRKISLGRNKKRKIRSLVHRLKLKDLDAEGAGYLAGFLSYAQSVEPSFVQSLIKKYGPDVLKLALVNPR